MENGDVKNEDLGTGVYSGYPCKNLKVADDRKSLL